MPIASSGWLPPRASRRRAAGWRTRRMPSRRRSVSGADRRGPSSRTGPSPRAEITRLEELRAIAFEERAEVGLAAGHHAELIGVLEATASQYPLRETPHAQLMLALYRSGRHAESLRVYQAFRRTLVDEAGLEPTAALQRLELDILRQAPGLDRADDDELEHGDAPRAEGQRAATFPPSLAVGNRPAVRGARRRTRADQNDVEARESRAIDRSS